MIAGTFSRRRSLAWLAPVAVAGVVAGGTVLATAGASDAAPVLPHLASRQLLSKAIAGAGKTTALSGTVHEVANLGLPDLPGSYGPTRLSWQTFVTGSHDFRVQVGGVDRQRVALLGQMSEVDVVHNGRDLWTYTSDTNTYSHQRLSAGIGRRDSNTRDDTTDGDAASMAPPSLAAQFLKAVTPSTRVSVSAARTVAGHAAYTLVLQPRDARSTVRTVTIALDSTNFVPLQVQILGAGSSPAFSVGFHDVQFSRPSASAFAFIAPAGATRGAFSFTATDGTDDGTAHERATNPGSGSAPPGTSVSGTAWTSIVKVAGARGGKTPAPAALSGLLAQLSSPIGSSGDRLVHTALINAVIRPDGTVFVGAVRPSVLEHAAAH